MSNSNNYENNSKESHRRVVEHKKNVWNMKRRTMMLMNRTMNEHRKRRILPLPSKPLYSLRRGVSMTN